MRHARGIRYLTVVMLVLFLAGCTETYAYLPSMGSKSAAPAQGAEGQPAAPPAPTAEAPAPAPKMDLPQQVQALEARVQQLETRLAELEGRQAAPAAAPTARAKERPATLSPSKAAYPAPAATASAADKTFTEGYHLYQGKKYAPARTKFSQYLKEQPKGPKAAEARYYLGDSFYAEGKYPEAAVEFNKMVGQHPKSILAPAAMLRQALAYGQQQQTGAYRNTLTKLVKAYPNSNEAKEAQKYLKEGKKEAPAKTPAKAPAKAAKPE
ncbi:MAG: tetratricopeptide repeat protein [Deltaproteobacteria bacterium]|nr:tetratricopeptide repeat protein [Deltaproteobacteria bacterium]